MARKVYLFFLTSLCLFIADKTLAAQEVITPLRDIQRHYLFFAQQSPRYENSIEESRVLDYIEEELKKVRSGTLESLNYQGEKQHSFSRGLSYRLPGLNNRKPLIFVTPLTSYQDSKNNLGPALLLEIIKTLTRLRRVPPQSLHFYFLGAENADNALASQWLLTKNYFSETPFLLYLDLNPSETYILQLRGTTPASQFPLFETRLLTQMLKDERIFPWIVGLYPFSNSYITPRGGLFDLYTQQQVPLSFLKSPHQRIQQAFISQETEKIWQALYKLSLRSLLHFKDDDHHYFYFPLIRLFFPQEYYITLMFLFFNLTAFVLFKNYSINQSRFRRIFQHKNFFLVLFLVFFSSLYTSSFILEKIWPFPTDLPFELIFFFLRILISTSFFFFVLYSFPLLRKNYPSTETLLHLSFFIFLLLISVTAFINFPESFYFLIGVLGVLLSLNNVPYKRWLKWLPLHIFVIFFISSSNLYDTSSQGLFFFSSLSWRRSLLLSIFLFPFVLPFLNASHVQYQVDHRALKKRLLVYSTSLLILSSILFFTLQYRYEKKYIQDVYLEEILSTIDRSRRFVLTGYQDEKYTLPINIGQRSYLLGQRTIEKSTIYELLDTWEKPQTVFFAPKINQGNQLSEIILRLPEKTQEVELLLSSETTLNIYQSNFLYETLNPRLLRFMIGKNPPQVLRIHFLGAPEALLNFSITVHEKDRWQYRSDGIRIRHQRIIQDQLSVEPKRQAEEVSQDPFFTNLHILYR